MVITSEEDTKVCFALTSLDKPRYIKFWNKFQDGVQNDDLILNCCLALCTSESANDRENLRVVHRDVVLLTEDRNLRVKAHTNDLPVTTVNDFMQWAFSGGNQ